MSVIKRGDIHSCLMMLHGISKSDLVERMEGHDVPDERREELLVTMDRTFMALIDILSRELGAGEATMPEIIVAKKKPHLRIVSEIER